MFCSYIHNTVVICPLTRSISPYMLVIFYNYIPLTSHNANKGKSCSGWAPTPLALSHQQNQKLLRLPPPPHAQITQWHCQLLIHFSKYTVALPGYQSMSHGSVPSPYRMLFKTSFVPFTLFQISCQLTCYFYTFKNQQSHC